MSGDGCGKGFVHLLPVRVVFLAIVTATTTATTAFTFSSTLVALRWRLVVGRGVGMAVFA